MAQDVRQLSRMTLDPLMWTASLAALLLGVSTLFLIIIYVLYQASGLIGEISLGAFLFSEAWVPLAEPPRLGIMHAWMSTLYVTAISLLVAVPLGVGIALFTAELAPPAARAVLQPCLEVLAGIPSVVYGFFGFVTLVVWFEAWFDMTTGVSILAAGLIVAITVTPFIASTATEALDAVSAGDREAGLSLGVTRFYTIRRIVLPRAMPGIFAGVVLGFARAIGETLAALMLIGNSVAIPGSVLDRGQTLTGLVATELGEAAVGTPKYHALFAASAVLMVLILLINVGILLAKKRLLRHGF
ncbi:MAG: phosphate ABC transporter permease subunit PstC [Gammaproteobacteria bacterium]|nr:phosphate ABC transporter permease subunit PstC [Gammaproteobacteria bacterium]